MMGVIEPYNYMVSEYDLRNLSSKLNDVSTHRAEKKNYE